MGKIVVCNAAYGQGGVGQHFAQVVEDARSEGQLEAYYTPEKKADDARGIEIDVSRWDWLRRYTPLRFSPSWSSHVSNDLFDRTVAKKLSGTPDILNGFVGRVLYSFRRARELGCKRLELMALNTHVANVKRQHARAMADWPIERLWMNEAQVQKTLKEYEEADVIFMHSSHVKHTFIENGISEEKLVDYKLYPDPRFKPATDRDKEDGLFRFVYTGALTTAKGTAVIVEAFKRLESEEARLILVGSWGTRGMRKYMQAAMQRDQRIKVTPGDPLPILQRSNVYVHPSYDDGCPYSLQEALACGLPAIVAQDTGGKELVKEGVNGCIVPTGNVDALYERLDHFIRHPFMCSTAAVR